MACLKQEQARKLSALLAFEHEGRWLAILAVLALAIPGYPFCGNAYAAPVAHAMLDQITATDKTPDKPAKKLWVCPMHPEIIQDHPGVCPKCGMDLVEMEQTEASPNGHSHGVHIDTASQQKLGVRLAAAKWQTLSQDIHAYGNVAVDESLVFNLSAKVEGVIKKIHVNSIGQQVRAGQVLYEIYSPELIKSQRELIELLKENDVLFAPMEAEDAHTNGKIMLDDDMMSIRKNSQKRILLIEKLLYADVGDELVKEVTKTYLWKDIVEVRMPQSGFVTRIDVHEGTTVKPMDNLFSFANLTRIWVDVPLYPDQLAWVKEGDEVTVKLPQSRMPEIKTRLQLITPVVDSTTRTVRARLSISNTMNMLPIGAYLDVIIHANPHKALAIPSSAVMRTGKGDLVMLSRGSGHFVPTSVETGIETGDFVEITNGLQADDQVAVNGQFLLDAAASMSDAAQRLHDTGEHQQ